MPVAFETLLSRRMALILLLSFSHHRAVVAVVCTESLLGLLGVRAVVARTVLVVRARTTLGRELLVKALSEELAKRLSSQH